MNSATLDPAPQTGPELEPRGVQERAPDVPVLVGIHKKKPSHLHTAARRQECRESLGPERHHPLEVIVGVLKGRISLQLAEGLEDGALRRKYLDGSAAHVHCWSSSRSLGIGVFDTEGITSIDRSRARPVQPVPISRLTA